VSSKPSNRQAPHNVVVRFAVERRVTMAMAVLGVLVLGWISLTRLPLEFLPSFSSSNITVVAPYRSSSPEEVERLVVRPLEDSLSTINGIETLSASATADCRANRYHHDHGGRHSQSPTLAAIRRRSRTCTSRYRHA